VILGVIYNKVVTNHRLTEFLPSIKTIYHNRYSIVKRCICTGNCSENGCKSWFSAL